MIDKVRRRIASWHGVLVEGVSISVGFATHKEHPEADVRELERIADRQMYEDKARYYEETGKDRRKVEVR